MELLQFQPFTLVFTFFLLFLAIKFLKHQKSNKLSSNTNLKLPPGPMKLPLIGNLHNLISPLNPHHQLRDLAKKFGPLMHLQLGEVSYIVISSPDIAEQVLKIHDVVFSARPYLLSTSILSYNNLDIVFAPFGSYWRQIRKICTMELLSASRVQSFSSIREEEVSAFIKSIYQTSIETERNSPVNLSEKIFSLTYGITSRAAFSNKSRDQEGFVSVIEETTKLVSGFCLADLYPSSGLLKQISGTRMKLEKLHRKADRILEHIVNEHREEGRRRRTNKTGGVKTEDLVDVLLKFQQDGSDHQLEFTLTDSNLKAIIFDIFSAGSETSSTSLEWAMSQLLKNPGLMKEAQAEVRRVFDRKGDVDEEGIQELKLLKAIVKETLRFHPSAPLLVPRECRENCVINGYDIPVKTRVIVNAWAIGRDPRHWSEAEKFKPERFLNSQIDFKGTDFEYIPFGAGRRICPGIPFALPNIELPLAKLLYHFDWKLPNGMKHDELDMDESFGISVRRKNNLFVIPIPYVSSKRI